MRKVGFLTFLEGRGLWAVCATSTKQETRALLDISMQRLEQM
jgi:hypothetical protein